MLCQGQLYGTTDTVVHGLLAAAIVGKAAMSGVVGVGPRHVEAQLDVWVGAESGGILEKLAHAWFIGTIQTRLRTGLLHGDVVPWLVLHKGTERRVPPVGAHAAYHLAVLKSVVLLGHIAPVGGKALPSTIAVTDNHLYTHLASQFIEVLFNGILREAVANGQHADGVALRTYQQHAKPRQNYQTNSSHHIHPFILSFVSH